MSGFPRDIDPERMRTLHPAMSPFELAGAAGADKTADVMADRCAYDRRGLLLTLRTALNERDELARAVVALADKFDRMHVSYLRRTEGVRPEDFSDWVDSICDHYVSDVKDLAARLLATENPADT